MSDQELEKLIKGRRAIGINTVQERIVELKSKAKETQL